MAVLGKPEVVDVVARAISKALGENRDHIKRGAGEIGVCIPSLRANWRTGTARVVREYEVAKTNARVQVNGMRDRGREILR